MDALKKFGWRDSFERAFQPFRAGGFQAGRVSTEYGEQYQVLTAAGEIEAEITGKLRYSVDSVAELPKVGDWVVLTLFENEGKGIIHEVLPRETSLSRKAAGQQVEEQVVATNLDSIFIIQALDQGFDLRRLEQYLAIVWESGAAPVIVLNKSDLVDDIQAKRAQVTAIAPDVTIVQTSTITGHGLEGLAALLKPAATYAFVGSSGAGKSSLINRLAGEETFKTAPVRGDQSKGRHPGNRRQLELLPGGALLIDTSGMRELPPWQAKQGRDDNFSDIVELADQCRFPDCTHTHEKGCAVLRAVKDGTLSRGRYKNYLKMTRELAGTGQKPNQWSHLEAKRKEKELQRARRRSRKDEYELD
jgi:ribosome biogenesis GTPase